MVVWHQINYQLSSHSGRGCGALLVMFVVVYKVCNFLYTSVVEVYKKLYIGETGGRLGDPFRGHLRDVEEMTKYASKPYCLIDAAP